jgi:hypothetical protein
VTYRYVHAFSYSDMETRCRVYEGDYELDLSDAAALLNKKDRRIAELEKESEFFYEVACESTNPEWLRNQAKALKEQASD